MKRSICYIVITLGLAALIALTLVVAADMASASPYASVETTACPVAVVKTTQHARRDAMALWVKDRRVRACFDRAPHARPPQLPLRAESEAAWREALSHYRSLTAQYRAEVRRLRREMRDPGQPVNGQRWRPLALWVGWTRAEWPTVLYIMALRDGHGESGGWPLSYNASSGCAGLMALHPGFYTGQWPINGRCYKFSWRDPEENLRAAEGIHDTEGFGPWSVGR